MSLLRLAPVAILLVACGNKPVKTTAPPAASQRAANQATDAGLPPTVVKEAEFGENDFTESDRNRDPFRSYASMFVDTKGKEADRGGQLHPVLEQYSIDELKLIAIVTGGDYPRAMLVDPTSKGWIVKKGDWVGRPDVVHTGGTNGSDYRLYWRVDRVRVGDVVLSREDPAQPGVAPATRVIPLHTESENNKSAFN